MWSTPSKDDALISPQEKASLSAIAGAADALQRILDQEIAAARGAILAGGGRVDQDGTVPDQIIPDLLAIAAWRYLNSYPALKSLQTAERKRLYQDARALMKQISRSEVRVELPAIGQALDTPTPVGQIQLASKSRREFTREKLRGL